MINISGLHLLLTYQCTFECDHCFVWGSPWQSGTMTTEIISKIIDQACDIPSIEWIYFEGGEPFLYYPILLYGIDYARDKNFKVGVVTNGYWANDLRDVSLWLKPMAGKVDDLSISSDLYHYDDVSSKQSQNILATCELLGIPVGVISIPQPDQDNRDGGLMYRGRAADKLTSQHETVPITDLSECPYENLSNPERFHIDPFGYIHICQGIVAGNLNQEPLVNIIRDYAPKKHPVIDLLIQGGPLKLARTYQFQTQEFYADACQLCYETRKALREQIDIHLQPDQMYGIYG